MSTTLTQTGHNGHRPGGSKGRVNNKSGVNRNNHRSQEFTGVTVYGPIHHTRIRLGQSVKAIHSTDETLDDVMHYTRREWDEFEMVQRITREDTCRGTHVNGRGCYMSEVWVIDNGSSS